MIHRSVIVVWADDGCAPHSEFAFSNIVKRIADHVCDKDSKLRTRYDIQKSPFQNKEKLKPRINLLKSIGDVG